jgi:iron complex outermembrane receptor protein
MKRIFSPFIWMALILYSSGAIAQAIQIRGSVKDQDGPVTGVSVTVKGGSAGTQTDATGAFVIQASKGDTLVFSSTGYITQETVIDDRTEYNITFATDA